MARGDELCDHGGQRVQCKSRTLFPNATQPSPATGAAAELGRSSFTGIRESRMDGELKWLKLIGIKKYSG